MWRKIDFQARYVGRRNTRFRRGRHAHIERRDATGALVMLMFSVTAQIAHDGSERVRKEGEVSGAAVLVLGAERFKYDKRGEDTIESTCRLDITFRQAEAHIRFLLA
jgi:hypothetical protein